MSTLTCDVATARDSTEITQVPHQLISEVIHLPIFGVCCISFSGVLCSANIFRFAQVITKLRVMISFFSHSNRSFGTTLTAGPNQPGIIHSIRRISRTRFATLYLGSTVQLGGNAQGSPMVDEPAHEKEEEDGTGSD